MTCIFLLLNSSIKTYKSFKKNHRRVFDLSRLSTYLSNNPRNGQNEGGGMQIWKKQGGCRGGGGGGKEEKKGVCDWKKPGGWGWVGRIIRGDRGRKVEGGMR